MQQAFPILLLNSKIHVPKPTLKRFPLCRLSPLSVRPFILPPHISMATDTLRDEAQPPRPQASGFSFGDAWAKATAKLSAGRGTPADPPLVSGQHGSETTSVPAWAQTETSRGWGGGRGGGPENRRRSQDLTTTTTPLQAMPHTYPAGSLTLPQRWGGHVVPIRVHALIIVMPLVSSFTVCILTQSGCCLCVLRGPSRPPPSHTPPDAGQYWQCGGVFQCVGEQRRRAAIQTRALTSASLVQMCSSPRGLFSC